MCDPYVEKRFLTAVPQSSCKNIQPCIVRCIDFSFKFIFIDWHCVGSIRASLQTSLIICASLFCGRQLKYFHGPYPVTHLAWRKGVCRGRAAFHITFEHKSKLSLKTRN